MDNIQGKHFSITDPKGVKTVIYQVNKTEKEFLKEYPNYFAYLPTRILNNCILLPIEADNEKTALRIFSTLNDRGKPLADADIFKAQFYKFYSRQPSIPHNFFHFSNVPGLLFRLLSAPEDAKMEKFGNFM